MSEESPYDRPVDGDGANGQGRPQEVAWVGQQHLMDGYCGRAIHPEPARPVAVVRTRAGQGKVVRIGPPRTPRRVA